jgi:hypothetical protein
LYQGGSRRKAKVLAFRKHQQNTVTTREIGELAVHRESVERALAENPLSLDTILDALLWDWSANVVASLKPRLWMSKKFVRFEVALRNQVVFGRPSYCPNLVAYA